MRALCHTDTIAEGQSKGFELEGQPVFVVRKQDRFFVYHNQCPHLGINLEWLPDQFLDSDGCLIQCAMHGALFLIDDGQCIAGPCQGQRLMAVQHELRDGQIWIDL
ncbi:MAG: Rieske (2Fe-2S) protein [Saccharospirillaceae bacterium]|nr:Rieske (2Fe-2S) protein [Saccharospirillaceae bacterium]MCD8530607.1 Rieske (2Fe-2S) protein [Saccharospirillaceae bacterium]